MSEIAQKDHSTVRVHIDRKPYEAKNPTTGAALYRLAEIGDDEQLFKSELGNQEDIFIPNDHQRIELFEDVHFYTEKEIRVIVNGRKKETVESKLSFEDVVKLAYEVPPDGANILFTITYRNGPRENREGSLLQGQSVKIKNGMVFNVVTTDKS